MRLLFCALVVAALLSSGPVRFARAEGDVAQIAVPYRSQFDGDPYEGGNCGPATMGMILAAYGKQVPTKDLRAIVNDLQGTWGMYDEGSLIENLGAIAQRYGLRPLDLFEGTRLRRWTLDDVRRHLRAGHPVVPQVWFRGLPGREQHPYNGDHYIALTGYDGDEFIYNDSVDSDGPGANRRMSNAQFDKAWRNSDFPYAALAIAVSDGGGLLPPTPTPSPTPTETPTPSPTATIEPIPSATSALGPSQASAQATPIQVSEREKATDSNNRTMSSMVLGGGLVSLLGIAVAATAWRRQTRG